MNQDMNGDTILVGILGFHGHSIEDASGLAAAHQKLKTSVAINRAAGQCWELCAQSCGSNEVCPEQVCQNDSLSLGRFPPRTSVLGGRKMRHCTSIAQQPRGLARPVRPTSTKTVRRTRGMTVRFWGERKAAHGSVVFCSGDSGLMANSRAGQSRWVGSGELHEGHWPP